MSYARLPLILLLTLGVGWTSGTSLAMEGYVVHGRLINWTMVVENSWWIGGSAEQIAKVRKELADNPRAVKLHDLLLKSAEKIDATLLCTLAEDNISTLTMIYVTVIPGIPGILIEQFAEASARTQEWQDPGSKVEIIRIQDDLKTDGYPAYRITLGIKSSTGNQTYSVQHIVDLGNRWHSFILKMDIRTSLRRLEEFNAMLASVKYR